MFGRQKELRERASTSLLRCLFRKKESIALFLLLLSPSRRSFLLGRALVSLKRAYLISTKVFLWDKQDMDLFFHRVTELVFFRSLSLS